MGIGAATSAILVGVAAGGVEYAATACVADAVLMGCVAAGMQVLQKGLPTLLAKTPDVSTGSGSTSTGTTTDPDSMLPVLYGKIQRNNEDNSLALCCETGTVKTWENVDGSYLFQSYAYANGELDGEIYQIYYGDTPLLIDDNSITSEGVVNSSQIADNVRDYVQIELYWGKSDYSQTSKSLPAQYAGDQWNNSTFWGNGVAQIYLVLRKDSDAAEAGLDDILSDNNQLTLQCSGMKIADVRSNEVQATNNPINQIYDYLTNGLYGAAIPPSLIDIASFQSAAEYCDTYDYFSCGCVSSQSSYTDTLNQICSTCGAVLYEKQGKLFVIPDIPSDSVMSVDESMIFGTVNLTTQGINDFFNTVDCQFTNIDNDFSSDTVRFPTELTDTDLAISGGRVIPQSVDLTWCQDTDQIATLGNRMLDKAKYSQTSFTFNTSYMFDIQIFDVFDLTFSEFGWNKKLFRVTSKSISTDPTTFGYVQIICVEYWPEVYDGDSAGNWSPDSYINPGVNVIAPTDLEVTLVGETTNGYEVLMSWANGKSTDPYLMGYYTYYRESGQSGWIASGSVDKYQTEYYLYGLNPDKTYDFAVAAYNNLSYTSAKCEVDNIVPDYDYQLPSVTGLVLTNKNETPTTTYSNYFTIAWDDQSNLAIGDSGKLFKDYFSYYEIRIYAKDGTYKISYSSNTTSFTYTYDENNHDGIGRSVIMGVIAHGQSSGTISSEVTLQVSNETCPKVLNVSAVSGIGEIVFSWSVDNMPPDWQSITIECSTTDQFTNIKSLTVPACEFAPFVIDDGSYYCRIAGLDFWEDDINWSDTIAVTQQTQIQPSQLSEDCVDAIVDSAQFEEAVTQYINNAGEDIWSLSVEGGTEDDPIIAGVSIGTDTETHTSSFNIMADEFVLVPSSAATTDQWISPFYVENGQVYMQSAIIHDASISNLMVQDAAINEAKIASAAITSEKIAQSIQSDNFVSGSTGWNINRDGNCEFDNGVFRGKIYANDGVFAGQLNASSGQFDSLTGYNSTFTNCTIDSSCVVNGQLYAENIIGDVYQFQSEWNMCSPIDGYIYASGDYPIDSSPVVGTKYVCVKLEGQNFEQKLSGNLGMYFDVGGHIGYKIILGGDGVADQEMFSFFTSNDYEEHTFSFNNMRLPAVGYGKYIYIWVECYQSDHGWSGEVICGCNIHFDQYGGVLQDTPSIALCKYTSDFATNS